MEKRPAQIQRIILQHLTFPVSSGGLTFSQVVNGNLDVGVATEVLENLIFEKRVKRIGLYYWLQK